jgi:hypothetical protein
LPSGGLTWAGMVPEAVRITARGYPALSLLIPLSFDFQGLNLIERALASLIIPAFPLASGANSGANFPRRHESNPPAPTQAWTRTPRFEKRTGGHGCGGAGPSTRGRGSADGGYSRWRQSRRRASATSARLLLNQVALVINFAVSPHAMYVRINSATLVC